MESKANAERKGVEAEFGGSDGSGIAANVDVAGAGPAGANAAATPFGAPGAAIRGAAVAGAGEAVAGAAATPFGAPGAAIRGAVAAEFWTCGKVRD